jgi:hypothetical protein
MCLNIERTCHYLVEIKETKKQDFRNKENRTNYIYVCIHATDKYIFNKIIKSPTTRNELLIIKELKYYIKSD